MSSSQVAKHSRQQIDVELKDYFWGVTTYHNSKNYLYLNAFANQMEAWNSKISKEPTPPQLLGWTKFNFDAAITRTLILYHTFYLNWKGHCPLTGSSGSKGHSRFQHLNHKPMSQVRLFWRRCQNFHWFNKQPDLRIEWDFSLNCKRYLILAPTLRCLINFFFSQIHD